MRPPRTFRLFFLLLAFALAACAAPAGAFLPSPTPAAFPSPTPLPSATPAPTRAPSPTPLPCREQSGSTAEIQVESAGLSAPLAARVHLPPCFDPAASIPYPVLYLLHGQGFSADQWERLGAPAALDRLTAAGEIQPMILVLPEEADTSANPFESPFGTTLIDSLLPAVERAYPACAARACRAIGGLSRGASWAVYLGFSHPADFAAVGAHSLPPFNGLQARFQGLVTTVPVDQLPALSIDIGAGDRYRSAAAEFETYLTQIGVPHEWYLNQGEHDETYWSAHVEEYIRWYASQLIPLQ
jgi:enterochelin esterase-like enzyme